MLASKSKPGYSVDTMQRRAFILSCLAIPAMALPARAGDGLRLLFVDKAGCPWCLRFERESLAGYLASDLARAAPLERASLDAGQPASAMLKEPVRFTPTFVLLRDDREIARIVGYQDNALFFGMVEKLIADARAPQDVRP
jgi:hypothetical protein